MGWIGGLLGNAAGQLGGQYFGGDRGRDVGGTVGSALGSLLPFKKGGRVKRTGPALVHKGEYVLPKGVKPTKAQKDKVAMLHKKK
jgi:hypothetical protein